MFLRCLAISALAGIWAFGANIQWQTVSPSMITSPPLNDVASGAGRFVTAGDGKLIYSEDNGLTWAAGTNLPPFIFQSLLFTNGLFIAAGSGSQIFSSDDGRRWEPHPISSSDGMRTLTYWNGLWV